MTRVRRRWAYVSIAILAVIAWGATLAFAPPALFWDDWVLNNRDMIAEYSQLGLPWMGYLNTALLAAGPWAFKVVDLVATILVGWLVFLITGRGLRITLWQRWLIAALVTVLPLNGGRVAVAVLDTYTLSLVAFFGAWWLFAGARADGSRRVIRYVIGAVLLMASYTTASLLPFTLLPVAHLLYLTSARDRPFFQVVRVFIRRFWFVIVAPILFWVLRALFLTPYGVYAGYNTFEPISRPLTLPEKVLLLMIAVFVGALVLSFCYCRIAALRTARMTAVLTGVLGVAVVGVGGLIDLTRSDSSWTSVIVPDVVIACGALLVVRCVVQLVRSGGQGPRRSRPVVMIATGLMVLAVAVVPYALVGKIPTFGTFDSRNQLLMPVGLALIIAATVESVADLARRSSNRAGIWIERGIGALLVAGFACSALGVSLDLVVDWNKQVQIIAALHGNRQVRESSTVVFADRTTGLGWQSRGYSFYETTGWLGAAYGNQKRLGLPADELPLLVDGQLLRTPNEAPKRYGFSEWHPTDDVVRVTIEPVANSSWLGLLFGVRSLALSVHKIHGVTIVR